MASTSAAGSIPVSMAAWNLYRSKSHRRPSNHMSVFIDDATDNRVRGGTMPHETARVQILR